MRIYAPSRGDTEAIGGVGQGVNKGEPYSSMIGAPQKSDRCEPDKPKKVLGQSVIILQ